MPLFTVHIIDVSEWTAVDGTVIRVVDGLRATFHIALEDGMD